MGPDYDRHTITIDDREAVDWDAALRLIGAITPPPVKVFEDGSVWDPWREVVAHWREQADDDERVEGTCDEVLALLEALNPAEVETVRALLRSDVTRLRAWAAEMDEGDFCEGYAVDGALHRVGAGLVLWVQADLRYFVCPLDGPYETLERLSHYALVIGEREGPVPPLLAGVPGVRVENEVL